mmetsp:Transcript_119303/g.210786  ORF Transcript_119303/g.210786 Transcript_119303/m.210786 type:complete len:671 (-) Transcript_119303:135-2147(-)
MAKAPTEQDAINAALELAGNNFPGVKDASGLTASRIKGGVSNYNFRVRRADSPDECGVVVRLRQPQKANAFIPTFQSMIGFGKRVERYGLNAASKAGLAPELLHYGENGDILITKEVNGRPLTRDDIHDPEFLKKLVPWIVKFHQMEVPIEEMPYPTWETGYRIGPAIQFKLKYMADRGYKNLPEDIDEIIANVMDIDALVSASSGPHGGNVRICHTDLVVGNILLCKDDTFVFVDFEYCARSHPDHDIAKLGAGAQYTPEEDEVLHQIYMDAGGGFGDGDIPGSSFARFQAMKVFELCMRCLFCSIMVNESTLKFEASWSDATTWEGACELLWAELRKAMADGAAARKKLARIRKCIVPCAGLASRLYPASKAVPKCFFPIYCPYTGLLKPLLQHTVERCLTAGIDEICLVVNPDEVEKVRAYFDEPTDPNVYNSKSKAAQAKVAGELSAMGKRVSMVIQEEALGFGDAIMRCRDFVDGEPFLCLVGDHAFVPDPGCAPVMSQVLAGFRETGEMTLAVAAEDESVLCRTAAYAATPRSDSADSETKLFKTKMLYGYPIEPEFAKTELAVEGVPEGKYLVSCGIFAHMPVLFKRIEEKAKSLTDARDGGGTCDASIVDLIKEGRSSLALIKGRRLDIGVPDAYVETLAALKEEHASRQNSSNAKFDPPQR